MKQVQYHYLYSFFQNYIHEKNLYIAYHCKNHQQLYFLWNHHKLQRTIFNKQEYYCINLNGSIHNGKPLHLFSYTYFVKQSNKPFKKLNICHPQCTALSQKHYAGAWSHIFLNCSTSFVKPPIDIEAINWHNVRCYCILQWYVFYVLISSDMSSTFKFLQTVKQSTTLTFPTSDFEWTWLHYTYMAFASLQENLSDVLSSWGGNMFHNT